jgi:D-arabinose 1-dehydrogenase-like Zn-dependent alcohol dehydrogenase
MIPEETFVNMSVTFDVFRGSPEGKIVADKTTCVLEYNEVFIETLVSGLCGTDEHYLKTGQVLGHEGVGIVKALGSGVTTVKVGDRVGFGYTHSVCADCDNCTIGKIYLLINTHPTHVSNPCRVAGWDQYCRNQKRYGLNDFDNGSFSYGAVWNSNCVYPIPEGYESTYAAPLICAGATVWSVLSEFGARPTDRVGIMGIGGLGHIAIKLAAAMGCHVVALSSSESKRKEAMEFGASEYHVFRSGQLPPKDFRPVKHLLLCGNAGVDYPS